MVEAEFNAYVRWYIRLSYGPIKENGQAIKRGWCMAQYFKFFRPGFKRIDAARNPGEQVVIVGVNRSTSLQALSFSIAGTRVTAFTQHTTSAGITSYS